MRVHSAPWVLTGGPSTPVAERGSATSNRGERDGAIADGAIALDGNTLLAVGPRAEVEARFGKAERLDAVILPALVNAHLHLELSHMKGWVAGGEGLPAWIQLFVAARPRTREGEPEQAMAMAAEDLVRAGVAAVGDITNTLASLRPLAEAGIAGTLFHEVFGFAPSRFEASLAAARAARAAAGAPPPGLRIVESPHAIYSTGAAALEALLRGGPGSLHLAEDPAERDFCATEGGGAFGRMYASLGAHFEELRVAGRSPVAAVAAHLRPHHLAVHCVDLDDEDVALLAATGATVVLCPRSNSYIVGRLPRLEALLAAGVPLAVGTDSLASSPSLAPLAELALLWREHPAVPAARLLPLAWNGAAVGASHVGRLVPGAAPGVLAAPFDVARVDDPFEYVVSKFGGEERAFTWLARQSPASPLTPDSSDRSSR
ncbi:amidohydrolase family protein [Anaeromyxobacter oryzae]|uniref:amidohydrolase family protein n=1 Tax=Anaeromyxobacter oryzae TaxID=2918170 RepID=UPI0020BDAD18|nr:amidohydrolase family protein [Anaeromyxobacter oryzae]